MKQSILQPPIKLKLFREFVRSINEHDLDRIYNYMTGDHTFIDAHGNVITGNEKMKAAWAAYFEWFPDYTIEIGEIFIRGNHIAALGYAGGTFKNKITSTNENYWHLPAAWKAVITKNKISLWQVYADTQIPLEIINKNK